MADIRSTAAEIRRGKKGRRKKKKEGKKLQGKNIMAPLLHRAAINSVRAECIHSRFQIRKKTIKIHQDFPEL